MSGATTMSADREPTDTINVPLSSYQLSLIRAVTPDIREGRQADFHAFIADMCRPLREITDRDVRTAIHEAERRYGRRV
jgi:hypothetical protein